RVITSRRGRGAVSARASNSSMARPRVVTRALGSVSVTMTAWRWIGAVTSRATYAAPALRMAWSAVSCSNPLFTYSATRSPGRTSGACVTLEGDGSPDRAHAARSLAPGQSDLRGGDRGAERHLRDVGSGVGGMGWSAPGRVQARRPGRLRRGGVGGVVAHVST